LGDVDGRCVDQTQEVVRALLALEEGRLDLHPALVLLVEDVLHVLLEGGHGL
jgi:hypothetical protein